MPFMSAVPESLRDARLDLRLPRATRALIVEAASLSGASLTDYVLNLVVPAARRDVIDAKTIRLSQQAWEDFLGGDSRTYVSLDLDSGEIAGYCSLAAWSVAHADTGGGWLARNAPEPVSVVLLGRLAVAIQAQGLGLGRDLVADALANARVGAAVLGARALVAEAIDKRGERFYARLGFWQSKPRHDLFAIKFTP
jgi:uncharacterized protein (DUF1778 family)/predicted GNAT family N-acyltransferase